MFYRQESRKREVDLSGLVSPGTSATLYVLRGPYRSPLCFDFRKSRLLQLLIQRGKIGFE